MQLQARYCRKPAGLNDPASGWREKIYRVWKQIYGNTFAGQGNSATFYSDSFMRYDMVLGIWDGDAVAGSSSYSFFDLGRESARDHSYARNLLTGKGLDMLQERGISRIMTFESFFIAPAYRVHKAWLAGLITHLGLEFYHEERPRHGLQAAVTVARVSKNMHEVAKASGFVLVCDDLFYNGETAALLLYEREKKRLPEDGECRSRMATLNVARV